MRGTAALLTAAAAVSAVVTPTRAAAESLSDGSLALDWHAPSGCPDGRAALQRIRALLAASPEAKEPVTASASVAQAPTDGAWTLELSTAQGERSFQRSVRAGSCEEATEAGALIIALAMDPELEPPSATPLEPSSSELAPKPAEPAPKPVEPEPKPPAATPRQKDRPPERRPSSAQQVHLRLGAMACGDVGSLPRPAAGAQAALALDFQSFRGEVVGTVFPAVSETIAAERGGDIGLLAGGARGCYLAEEGRLNAGACVGVEIGRLEGKGFGATNGASWNDSRSSLWFAPRASVLTNFVFSPAFSVRLGLEALVPTQRPEFVLENVGSVHQPTTVVGRLDAGLEMSL